MNVYRQIRFAHMNVQCKSLSLSVVEVLKCRQRLMRTGDSELPDGSQSALLFFEGAIVSRERGHAGLSGNVGNGLLISRC